MTQVGGPFKLANHTGRWKVEAQTVLILRGTPEQAPPPCPAVTLAMHGAGVVDGNGDGTFFAPPLLPSSPFSSPSALALGLGTMSKSLTRVQ